MALHLVLWSLVLTAHVAAWPAEDPTQWGSIEHSLANSRNTTCVKETRFAATEALFERAATAVGPGLPGLVAQFYASSPHAPPGQPGKLNPPPADMLSSRLAVKRTEVQTAHGTRVTHSTARRDARGSKPAGFGDTGE